MPHSQIDVSPNKSFRTVLELIAKELDLFDNELYEEDTAFSDLGVDVLSGSSIAKAINENTELKVPGNLFQNVLTIGQLKAYVSAQVAIKSSVRITPQPKPAYKLCILLQGNRKTASKNIFIFPDGAGSAMAYARIPALSPDCCLYGLNSPFLHDAEAYTISVAQLAAMWVRAIREVQHNGPYTIGGWSAGGYYAYEAMKCLHRQGQRVDKIVLIDSPCRLDYEALPPKVVVFLAAHNLMGDGTKKETPPWLVSHFLATLRAIDQYMPTIVDSFAAPDVCIVWASEALLPRGVPPHWDVDLSARVSRLLILPRADFGPNGWERLFPNSQITVSNISGNHFNLIHPPNAASLAELLRAVVHIR